MARAQATDPLMNFRFFAEAFVAGQNLLGFTDSSGAQAGFTSVTVPSGSTEVAEYKEGHMRYKQKYPGVENWEDMTLMRGVFKTDTTMFDWWQRGGSQEEYRADMVVYHWHKDGKEPGKIGDKSKARQYQLFNAFSAGNKPSGDLDATSSEVSIAELTVAFEWMEIVNAQ